MFNLKKLLIASFTVVGITSSLMANAASDDALACSVAVNFTSGAGSLTYAKVFEVSPTAPFSDDFSTLIRFKFFDASMTVESGIPVVKINFDADVSVFNSIGFGASLKVRDASNGETISGDNAFYSSVPGGGGANVTKYTLSCKRAKI
ncbi:MAG: hypothetical protein ABL869_11770 [Candidatus Nitrotoga sp.]